MRCFGALMVVSIAALMSACAPAQRSGIEVGEVWTAAGFTETESGCLR